MADSAPMVARRTPLWRIRFPSPITVRHRGRTYVLITLQDAADFVLQVLDDQDQQKPHWRFALSALLAAGEECSDDAIQNATLELQQALSKNGLVT
jgi:hypothetical protein